jgi:hypothetical protein
MRIFTDCGPFNPLVFFLIFLGEKRNKLRESALSARFRLDKDEPRRDGKKRAGNSFRA